MKAQDYMYEAKNVSAVLGRENDVNVVFEGDGAYTDGSLIVLPSVDSEHEMNEFSVKVARGYVDHEAAHVKWTDDKQWKTAVNRFKRSKTDVELKAATMNALEDVRIEAKLIDLYAGSRDNLEAVAQSVLVELESELELGGRTVESLDAVEVGGLAATWYGRMKAGYGDAGGEFFGRLDGEIQDAVRDAVDRIDDASTTKDMGKLSEELVSTLVAMSERKEKEDEDSDDGQGERGDGDERSDQRGEQSGEGDGDDGETDGGNGDGRSDGSDNDGRGESKQTQDGEKSGDSDADAVSQGDAGDDGKDGGEPAKVDANRIERGKAPEKKPFDPDALKAKAVARELSKDAGAGNGRGHDGFRRFSDRHDREVGKEELMEASSNYDQLLSETAGQTNVLRRTLERKLSAKMKRSWVGGQMNGRLDSRRLVGAYTGSEHVYKVREESDDLDTAVVILVDHSGSMTCRIRTAAKACVALAVALENTPIAYAIQGFTTELLPDKVGRKVLKEYEARVEYESYCPVVTLRYKEFDERLVRVKGKLGGMEENFCHRSSLNVDGVSVEKAGRELMMRPEKRKVLMVLSDGEPNDGYSLKEGGCEKHLKHVINGLANKGVEVFGIGIESKAVKDYYPNYAVLNSVEDLEKEVIGRMDGLLVGGMDVRKAS